MIKLKYLPIKKIAYPGDPCDYYIFVLNGSLKIQIVTESGREVVLYHVREGEDCVLTTSCLLGSDTFPAEVISEEDTKMILISAKNFQKTLRGCPR